MHISQTLITKDMILSSSNYNMQIYNFLQKSATHQCAAALWLQNGKL